MSISKIVCWNVNGASKWTFDQNLGFRFLIFFTFLRCIPVNIGIRALRTKVEAFKGSFKAFLDSLEAEVFVFQETKVGSTLKDLEETLLHVDGYESYYSLCTRKSGYSGVATYVKKGLTVDAKATFGKIEFEEEGRVMMTDHGSFVLFNVYFPNAGRDEHRLDFKMSFYRWFEDIIDSYVAQKKNVIVAGDVNTTHKEIDIWCPERLHQGMYSTERKWMDSLLGEREGKEKFIDTFRFLNPTAARYTWWDVKQNLRITDQGYRIDYLLVNESFNDQVLKSEIMKEQLGSDHCPIYLVLRPQSVPIVSKPPSLSSEAIKARQPRISSFFAKASSKATSSASPTPNTSSNVTGSSITSVGFVMNNEKKESENSTGDATSQVTEVKVVLKDENQDEHVKRGLKDKGERIGEAMREENGEQENLKKARSE